MPVLGSPARAQPGHPHASICHSHVDRRDPETLFSEDVGLRSRPAGATIPRGTSPPSRWEGPPGEGHPHLSFQTGVTCSAELRAALTRPRSYGEPRDCKAGFRTRCWEGRGQNAVRVGVAAGLWRLRAAGRPSTFSARHRSQVPFVFFGGDSVWPVPPALPDQPTRWGRGWAGRGSPEWPAHSLFPSPAGRATEVWLEFAQRTSHDLTGTRTGFPTSNWSGN